MLKNKVALITGSSRGIGKAIAIEFAKNGATVVVNYNENEKEAEKTIIEIKKYSPKSFAIKADVSKIEEVKNIFIQIKEKFGKVDILVNNAGVRKDNLIIKTSQEEWSEIIDVNLKGTFNCIQEATKLMILNGGKIINITSVVGIIGNPGQAAYTASKAGVIALTKTAAKELAELKITVNAIAPGLIETDMVADLAKEQRDRMIKMTTLKRA